MGWEANAAELRWQHPATGEWFGAPGAGLVAPNEWLTVTWTIEEDYMAVSVNGEERLRAHGDFRGGAGQVGIGTAFGAKVTIGSARISGATASAGEEIVPPPRFRWDGGFIYVKDEDHEKAIQWYCDHLGLTLKWPTWDGRHDPSSHAEKMSSLAFPAGGLLHLKSVSSDAPLAHFPTKWSEVDAGVGFTFNSPDVYAARHYFSEKGIPVGDIVTGPDGQRRFEIRAFDGTKLTLRAEERDDDAKWRVSGYGPWYVMVPDVEQAAQWYMETLETNVVRVIAPGQAGKRCTCTIRGGTVSIIGRTNSIQKVQRNGKANVDRTTV